MSPGAIPPIAEMQSFFWISLIKGLVRKPLPPPHYHLLVKDAARIKYGVDHSTYMSTLAKDIGAAPGLWELWLEYGTHVLICYWCVSHSSVQRARCFLILYAVLEQHLHHSIGS